MRYPAGMVLERLLTRDLAALMGWFSDAHGLLQWGGPAMRWPIREREFVAALRLEETETRVVRDGAGALAGFGQYYRKLDRCHLARVAVSPRLRGRGHGSRLVRTLMAEGTRALAVEACSLYVLSDNAPAIRCYERCGFRFAEDPEPVPALPDCLFMVAPAVGPISP